ncbi:MAG: transposase [Acidobacteria bacterium]|nr:transposase [Acidobacteriota bacterium]
MTKQTTRKLEYTHNPSVLFAAFELSNSEWKLAFSVGLGQKARRRNIPAGGLKRLEAEFAAAKKRFSLKDNCEVVSCYEAGRDGLWLHRYLTQSGIKNLVVDSSSIEVNRKARRAKADGLDVEKLLTMIIRYHHGEHKVWSVLSVPSVEEEDRRQLHRELRTLKKERTRTANRIRGLLASQGIRLGPDWDLSDERLEEIRLWDGSPLPPGLRSRTAREWEHMLFLEQQVRTLESQRRKALKRLAWISTENNSHKPGMF